MDTSGKRLRLLYSDVHGLDRGKYLFGEPAANGVAAFCFGVYPLTHDKEILPVPGTQFDVGLPDVEARLDRDTLRPGWEDDTVVGIADVEHRGAPVAIDPRHVLRRACRPWQDMGLEPQIAFELEFYLLEPDDRGSWRAVDLPSHRVTGNPAAIAVRTMSSTHPVGSIALPVPYTRCEGRLTARQLPRSSGSRR